MQRPQGGQTLNIHLDRATGIFPDGMITHFVDLKAGGYEGIELPNEFKGLEVWLHFVPAYRY